MFGCGCWAEKVSSDSCSGIACSTSGKERKRDAAVISDLRVEAAIFIIIHTTPLLKPVH